MNMPIVLVLVLLAAGCAHSQKKESVLELAAAPTTAEAPSETSAMKRIPLPYTFARRGVSIRVNSVEFAKDKLQVSVTLQEVRSQPGSILTSTLMEPRTSGKQVLPYSGYSQNGETQPGSQISLKPDEKMTVDLLFQLPAEASASGIPIEIQFTTGKWWSSQD